MTPILGPCLSISHLTTPNSLHRPTWNCWTSLMGSNLADQLYLSWMGLFKSSLNPKVTWEWKDHRHVNDIVVRLFKDLYLAMSLPPFWICAFKNINMVRFLTSKLNLPLNMVQISSINVNLMSVHSWWFIFYLKYSNLSHQRVINKCPKTIINNRRNWFKKVNKLQTPM